MNTPLKSAQGSVIPLRFLGFELNSTANQSGQSRIEHTGSKPILIIQADEEAMIRNLCLKYLGESK